MTFHVVHGDLLDQPTEALVNPWNRNVLPWWLLLPQGVSGAIKRRAGLEPFRALAKMGPIPLGGAVVTGAGDLPQRALIHVAGINLLWRASERSIRDSVVNAVTLAEAEGLAGLAMPLIGTGSGGFPADRCEALMRETLADLDSPVEATLVLYRAT